MDGLGAIAVALVSCVIIARVWGVVKGLISDE